jgi:hypothetical protein
MLAGNRLEQLVRQQAEYDVFEVRLLVLWPRMLKHDADTLAGDVMWRPACNVSPGHSHHACIRAVSLLS